VEDKPVLGLWELVFIFAIVVLIFGARRIPEIAKGIGKGIREFRKALEGSQDGSRSQDDSQDEEKDGGE
jgi:sec-independent protein translocase protein TatA